MDVGPPPACSMQATKPELPIPLLADVSVDAAIRSCKQCDDDQESGSQQLSTDTTSLGLHGDWDGINCIYLGDSDWSWPLKVSLRKGDIVIKNYFIKVLSRLYLAENVLRLVRRGHVK